MPAPASRIQRYLQETLGVPALSRGPWIGQEGLPYFLRDAFELAHGEILGIPILLALDRHPGKSSVGEIRARLEKIRSLAGLPAVYVTDALASYERKRLIQQKIPFIVPGNQLYLPDLGIDLREYFRQRPSTRQKSLSPSAQAMLITALLRANWQPQWQPAEVAARLGYTPMTLSRAVRELVAAGVAHAHKSGRTQYLEMPYSPRETWERVRRLLRNPVQRSVWIAEPIETNSTMCLAGLSALAQLSLLTEPSIPVYAMSLSEWKALQPAVEELPEPSPGAQEWQLWSYSPEIVPDGGVVDPLSLMLSLNDSGDERVQSALDELKEQLPW